MGAADIADIAVLSSEAETGNRDPDTGAGRILLEGHFLFDLIDRQVEFAPYKMLILPDVITVDAEFGKRIDAYLASGGKLLLTGKSGLKKDESGFAFDIGASYHGESPFQPDYVEMDGLAPEFMAHDGPGHPCPGPGPVVMYMRSQQVKATSGEVLARIREPYFNRTWKHFCSHQHAPAAGLSEYAAAVRKGSVLYLAHPVFAHYYAMGAVAYKDYVVNAIRALLGDAESISTNLPSTARVALTRQADYNRFVLHLLYANTIARGAQAQLSPEGYVRGSNRLEVIEDLLPLRDVEVTLALPEKVESVTLEPQGKAIPFEIDGGRIKLKVNGFTCHQMVALHY